MKTMVITGNGDTDVFQEKEVLMPRPQGRELLVKVHATSVNPVDIKIRKGMIQTGIMFP